VKFYEKGDRPLEIVTSRQWFVRSIGFRDVLLQRARELQWHPAYMQGRLENWINGLNGDWCISRQRFFGVPFPVWYPVRADGTIDYAHPIAPSEDRLPIDPSTDVPDGYQADQRNRPGGFSGDPDIMDTWATSSLTPQIAGGWLEDEDLFARVFPMDVRPQAHDIIRTWLFSTMLRSELEFGVNPWAHAAISGWVLDPDRKKMSKSKGNVVTPMALLEEHGSDGVRYWAASARPGTDTAFDPGQMKVGRRLAIKLLNASKFVLGSPEPQGEVFEAVDKGLLTMVGRLVREATQDLEDYNYASVLQKAETLFWFFCDNYLELVKSRRYGDSGPAAAASANTALLTALSALLRVFALYLPFVTEEVWSWWRAGSVHTAAWPLPEELFDAAGGEDDRGSRTLQLAADVLGAIRKKKSEEQRPMKTAVAQAIVRLPDTDRELLKTCEADLKASGLIQELVIESAPALEVIVRLAPPDAASAVART
jgi:valyl-tRNA synthetase